MTIDTLAVGSRARTPIKGLRVKLRTFLRAQGVTGKFRTDLHRDGTLLVLGTTEGPKPETFEGRAIRYVNTTKE